MTKALECDEGGVAGVRRIARSQIEEATKPIAAAEPTDEAVHAARKELKRARASLRLLRDALGRTAYDRENAALRDVARPLTRLRDAKVLGDTLENLLELGGNAGRAPDVAGLRRQFRREHTLARQEVIRSHVPLRKARQGLRAATTRSARWPVRGGWSMLGTGLKREYAKGRKAFSTARTDRSAENLHEWRKQVKYLWHQLQVLQPLWPGLIGELADQTHKLADYLGDDRDLYMLQDRIAKAQGKDAIDAPIRNTLLALIARRRAELQDKAIALGQRLYDEKPKAFETRFRRYWRAWRSAPLPRAA